MRVPQELITLGKILQLLRGVNIHPLYLVFPVVLSIAAAGFEGISVSLLIPLLNGFLTKDFSFILEVPMLGAVLQMFPESVLSRDRSLFGALLTLFVAAVFLKNILRYSATVSITYFSLRSLHHLRKVMFQRYLSFGKLFFDRTSVGHHSTVLTEFSHLVLRPVLTVNKFMNAFFSLVGYLVVMSLISWKLTFFALPLFVILHFSVKRLIARITELSHSIAEKGSALGKKTIEILSTIPLVKSYGTEKEEAKKYAQISDEKAQLDFRVIAIGQLVGPLQEMLTLIVAMLLFSAMLYLLTKEQMGSASSFIVYFYLVLNASSKFGTLTGSRADLAAASGPLKEVKEIFSEEGKYFVPGGKREFAGLQKAIEFRQLDFAYAADRPVLEDVTFTVKKGSLTAIVGPTGAGKTTLINLLVRYYDCPPGSLFVDDTDIREFNLHSLVKHLALVSQDTLLLHDTLQNNIAYGLTDVPDAAVQDAVEKARLAELVERLPQGLDTLIGDRGVKLSGGEKQRVSIARALLKGAEILILDEATSSLDSKTEQLIQEAVNVAIEGRTAIVIAHRLSTVQHADSIVVLEGGRVVETGTLDVLLEKKGKFHELWEAQKFI